MKSSVEKVSSLERKLNIQIPAEKVAQSFTRVFQSIQRSANIKGFRQGKAPLETIRSMYNDRVQQDVVQDLVQQHYYNALKEHKLAPINYPEFEFDAPVESKEFSFTAIFEIKPEIKLNKYEGLAVEVEKLEIEPARIDKVIENILSARSKFIELPEARTARSGDFAILDFKGFVDGAPLDRGAGEDFQLELGSNQFITGFEEGIVGMSIGDKKTLNLKFPEQYQAAELSGKPVDFEVTLKAIKIKQLPEMNDEFVKDLGGDVATVLELRSKIRADLEESEKQRIQSDLKNRVLKALVKVNPVEVPNSLLKEQMEALKNDTKKRMSEQGMTEEQFAEYAQKWDQDFQNTASEIIQSSFLVDTIAAQHQLHWTEEDIEAKMNEYVKQTGIELEKIKSYYGQPDQKQRLTYMITEEKVIKFLLDKAQKTEVESKNLSDKN